MLISPWLLLVWRVFFVNRARRKTHTSTAAPPYLRDFLFRIPGGHSDDMFFLILVKIGCFLSRGFGLGAPAVYGLPCLVVWAAAVCRALLRCTGFPVWSFGLLRLAGRSCGARASLSGRLGCCGLPGALAVHGLPCLVVWAAAVCRALSRCMGFGLLRQLRVKYMPAITSRISRLGEPVKCQNIFLIITEGTFPEYLSQ